MTQFILSGNSETQIYEIFCSKLEIFFKDLFVLLLFKTRISIQTDKQEQTQQFLNLFQFTLELISNIDKICVNTSLFSI
jgi:hypothetical protein